MLVQVITNTEWCHCPLSPLPSHYSIHYVIKAVSDLRQAGFLHQWNWPPRYNWNIVESGVKHHDPSPLSISTKHFVYEISSRRSEVYAKNVLISFRKYSPAKSEVPGLKGLSEMFLWFDRQFKVLLFLLFNPISSKYIVTNWHYLPIC